MDALKRHPQCEDVYRCLLFKEIRILYMKEPSPKGFVFTRKRRRRTTPSSLRATFATRDVAKKIALHKVYCNIKPGVCFMVKEAGLRS